MTFLQASILILSSYIALTAFCVLFMKKRTSLQIRQRRARQRPLNAGLAGVFGQDIAVLFYCLYLRSPLALLFLWISRGVFIGFLYHVYGPDFLTENSRSFSLILGGFYSISPFISMYASANLLKQRAINEKLASI
jgi:hypothetical protein